MRSLTAARRAATASRSRAETTPDEPQVGPDVRLIGARVRTLRDQSGLTLAELAARSGVSRAMLSKVERAEKSPTLSILARIAAGLDVRLSELLGAEPSLGEVDIVRRAAQVVYTDPETGFERRLLSPAHVNNGVELLMHVLPPGSSSGLLPAYTAPTEKFIAVQSGELSLEVAGQRHRLAAGDAIHFEVNSSYTLVNPGAEPCVCYVVVARLK
jgi:transcriptional regulator with XRE-family HTH domain